MSRYYATVESSTKPLMSAECKSEHEAIASVLTWLESAPLDERLLASRCEIGRVGRSGRRVPCMVRTNASEDGLWYPQYRRFAPIRDATAWLAGLRLRRMTALDWVELAVSVLAVAAGVASVVGLWMVPQS